MATFELNSIIKIGDYARFRGVNEVRIKKGIRNYLETAVIKLPGVYVLKKTGKDDKDSGTGALDPQLTANAFKRGDRVSIQLGYTPGNLRLEFSGYVSRVNKTTPVEIECEGWAFELHSKRINKVWGKTTLRQVLQYIVQDTYIDLSDSIPDAPMDACQLIGESGISALEALKKMFGGALFIWMDGQILYAGLAYMYFTEKQKNWKPDVVYKVGWNTIRDDQMKEHLAGDQPTEFVVSVRDPKTGKYARQRAGLELANQERRRLQNIPAGAPQKNVVAALYDLKNYNGFEGKLTAFLQPYCKHAYKAQVVDARYAERSGNYLIEEVEITYGRSGARRNISLSRQLSNG